MNKSAKKLRSITGRHATLNLRQKPMDEVHGSRRGGGPRMEENARRRQTWMPVTNRASSLVKYRLNLAWKILAWKNDEHATQDQLVSLQTSSLEIKTEPKRQSRALLGNLMCLKLDNIQH